VRHGAAQQGRRAEGVAHPRLERGQRRVERGGGERRGGAGKWEKWRRLGGSDPAPVGLDPGLAAPDLQSGKTDRRRRRTI
jgi:hypothetical protein